MLHQFLEKSTKLFNLAHWYDCCWGICIWYWFNNTENGFWVGPFPFKWVLGLSHLVTEPKSQSRTPTFCTNMSSSLKWGAILVKDVVTYSHLGPPKQCSIGCVSWKCWDTGFTRQDDEASPMLTCISVVYIHDAAYLELPYWNWELIQRFSNSCNGTMI